VKHLLIPRNSEAELLALEDVCTRLTGFDLNLSYERVDGFLTGLAACGSVPETTVWLQALAGDSFERVFADPPDQARATTALQARLHVLRKQLDPAELFDDPQTLRLEPLMESWDDGQRQQALAAAGLPAEEVALLQTGSDWAAAFFDAWETFADMPSMAASAQAEEVFAETLVHVEALMWPADAEEFTAHLQQFWPDKAPTRDELLAQALWSVQDLRMLWVDFAPVPATVRVEVKPGRNDPCHCGSGKKFKKCHGA
jgi:uncharacterized protein